MLFGVNIVKSWNLVLTLSNPGIVKGFVTIDSYISHVTKQSTVCKDVNYKAIIIGILEYYECVI